MCEVRERVRSRARGIGSRRNAKVDPRGELQELGAVLAGICRDAAKGPLLEEVVRVVSAPARRSDGCRRSQACRRGRAPRARAERVFRRVRRGSPSRAARRCVKCITSARRSEFKRETLRLGSAGEHMHASPARDRDLRREVRRGAKAVDAESSSRREFRAKQCSVANDSCAKQRRGPSRR